MALSFDDYKKRIEAMGASVPKIFNAFSKQAAIHFRNEAVAETDRQGLVDTGNYRRNWNGQAFKEGDDYGVICSNEVEYASWLEEGHGLRGINENRKYKIKRPNQIDIPKVRYKGHFVGRAALEDTRATLLIEMDKELDILFTMKDANVDRATAKKWTGHTGRSMWNKKPD
jgi:hypothetical protein